MVDSVRPLRNAASLILVRGEPLEVLMVRRHARASFTSSYVFPGGVVEPDDADDAWLPRLIGADTLSRPERAPRASPPVARPSRKLKSWSPSTRSPA
jgi:8-oxo-dGTP pyrophosphatase MutT (NUDIX family)